MSTITCLLDTMAHSCIHCQKFVLAQPTPDEDPAARVDVLAIDVLNVMSAASDGCAFFRWCLLQHPKTSESQGFDDVPFLRVSMHPKRPGDYTKFVSLRWEARDGSEFHIKHLLILTQQGPLTFLIFIILNT